MGRRKTITDEAVLAVARQLFRARGHTATTREIADAAGVSEGVLYQRFGSKDELFFAAMHPAGPDVDELLGPDDPPGDGREYVRATVARMGRYFSEVIPLALRVLTHPAAGPEGLARVQPGGAAALEDGLTARLASLTRRKRLGPRPAAAARLLVCLAHDWALRRVLAHASPPEQFGELEEMVDVVWDGLRAR